MSRFLQRVEGAREQHRDHAGVGHRRNAVFVDMFEMIGRQRIEPRGHFGAAAIAELLGVELDAQAMLGRGVEQPFGLRHRKGDAFAEGVDAGGEAGARDGGDHLVDHHVDIFVALVGIGRRQRVEREQGGDDAHRLLLAERLGGIEQAQFAGAGRGRSPT